MIYPQRFAHDDAVTTSVNVSAGATVALTFDDLPATREDRIDNNQLVVMTDKLLNILKSRGASAVGFINGVHADGPIASLHREVLARWISLGFHLHNHTFSHVSLHRVSMKEWKDDVIRCKTLLRLLSARGEVQPKYFRHPYLDMGLDEGMRSEAGEFLAEQGYRIAPVTMDSSDWMFASRYESALSSGDSGLSTRVSQEFLCYLDNVVAYGGCMSRQLLGYELRHILLLHANRLVADTMGQVLDCLKEHGYTVITLQNALLDKAYSLRNGYYGPIGTTWLNQIAVTSGVLDVSQISPVFPFWTVRPLGGGSITSVPT